MAKLKAAKSDVPAAAVANGRSVGRAIKRILAIGPITIQSKLYLSASSESISFNMIHDLCKSKVKQAGMYCPCCLEVEVLKPFLFVPKDSDAAFDGIELKAGDKIVMHSEDVQKHEKKVKPTEQLAMVEKDHIVKGYDVGNEQFVTITKEEIESARAMNDDLMLVEQFVPLSQVNPVYFEKSYYLEPDPTSSKSFALLRTAMVKQGVAAVAKFTAYQQERLIFVLPYGSDGMAVHEAFLPDEIRSISFPALAPVSKEEEAIAAEFVQAMSGDLDMGRYKDAYQANLLALIEAKKDGKNPSAIVQKVAPKAEGNLLEMLKAGIVTAKAKGKRAA